MDTNQLNEYFSGSFKFIEWRTTTMTELPEELEELKLRLQLELDGALNGGTNYSFQPSIIGTIIKEWYEEYAEDYEKTIMSVDSHAPSVKENATHWALQNLS